MIIDGKRLTESERLRFMIELETTGEFHELSPYGLPVAVLLPSSPPSATHSQAEAPRAVEAITGRDQVCVSAESVAIVECAFDSAMGVIS